MTTTTARMRDKHEMVLVLFAEVVARKLGVSLRAAGYLLDAFLEGVIEEDPALWDEANLCFYPEGMTEVNARLKALTNDTAALRAMLLLNGSPTILRALETAAMTIQETVVARDEMIALVMSSTTSRLAIAGAAKLSEGRLYQIRDQIRDQVNGRNRPHIHDDFVAD